ncbi:hypothetical protein SDC9_204622 [bioreactor metagenome]|uniref:Uncharacterized protein n=1 Tax=bioreactor metagenome TaxID=1076179 RepID=A0A645J2I7_9ZZZZ
MVGHQDYGAAQAGDGLFHFRFMEGMVGGARRQTDAGGRHKRLVDMVVGKRINGRNPDERIGLVIQKAAR